MMRWRRMRGLEVIDTSTAESVGSVTGLVLDRSEHAVRVGGLGVDDHLLELSGAVAFGPDAITTPEGALGAPHDGDLLDPVGIPVITDDGVELGKLSDLDIDTDSGTIRRLVLADDDIPARRLLGIGTFAAVVLARGSSPGTRTGSGATGSDRTGDDDTAGALSDLTKEELYEMAKERDVPGRSKMDKAELRAALR